MPDEVTIERAVPDDAGAILDVQRRAFRTQAEIYDDHSIPPLRETAGDIRRELGTGVVLKAVAGGRLAGSVRGQVRDGGRTCRIARLSVDPDFTGRGIGTRLVKAIEREFGGVERYELFTGHKSGRVLRLCDRLGYRRFRTEKEPGGITLVFMEKTTTSHRGGTETRRHGEGGEEC